MGTYYVAGAHNQLITLVHSADGCSQIYPLSFAEDAAPSSGDTGVAIWGRPIDSLAQSAGTTGDYCTFNLDANGRFYCNVQGTSAADIGKAEDAAHTDGDTGVPSLAVRTDAPTNRV